MKRTAQVGWFGTAFWAMLVAIGPNTASAQSDAKLEACLDVVGTFMTYRSIKDDGAEKKGRSMLSLTNGGQAFFTDSAQGGGLTFQPFTEGRGSWRCISNEDGKVMFSVLVFHFTLPTHQDPRQKISRVITRATYDLEKKELTGQTAIVYLPLYDNPMGAGMPGNRINYKFTGFPIVAPE
ncbi:MAG: hypothetical protein ABJN26_07810 [Stappiaceae bacterium]